NDGEKNRTIEIIAKQGAYILMNQILFYKILESESAYSGLVQKLSPVRDLSDLPLRLKSHFENVIRNVDFKAIFEQDPIFNGVPITEQMAVRINEFIEELKEYDLTVFKSDVIGRIYEDLIPAQERHDLGQYYTPPQIAELITRMTITKPDALILDPSCGSGGFLVKAYLRLRELKSKYETPSHQEILSQINGIDINRFPAHLSAINLAIQDIAEKTNNVRIEIADFFNVRHGQTRFARRIVTLDGEQKDESTPIPNQIDVIISNPPYIRQEKIVDKAVVRQHIEELGFEIEERADIYAYFFTHAYQFLNNNGSIGFITSDKWLDTKYGIQLSKFLLEHLVIKCIVKFDKQVFADPLIGTVVIILQKEVSKGKRDNYQVRLLRLKMSMSIEDILDLINEPKDPETVYETPRFRLVLKSQQSLSKEWKWLRYLYAPKIYFDIMKTGKLTILSEVADVTRGRVTGANEFFYMTREEAKSRGLEMKYLKPIMKAIAQAEFVNFKKEDTEWLCLDLHDVVRKIVSNIEKTRKFRLKELPTVDLVKKEIRKQSKPLYDYLEWGEEKEFNKTPTCKNRKIWFDIGELLRPQLIFPDVYWKHTSTPFNADRIAIDKQLYAFVPKDGNNEGGLLLGGIMNFDINALMREMYGRTVGGEGLNRNQVMVWEANEMPVVDPREIDEKARSRIIRAFNDLVTKCRDSSESKIKEMRHELNLAVMSTVGLESRTKELEEEVSKLIDIRISGGGEKKDTMVESPEEEGQVIATPLKGARLIGRGSSLDRFLASDDT
ncbi:MAG: HsdM family class I SAM-dependent methyltransferase, partial [Nitrososphaerales archaeon]